MTLGENLRQLRQEKGLTQASLGAYLNLAESTISLYEAGKRSPDHITLKRLADFFAVTVDYLLKSSPSMALDGSSDYNQDYVFRPLPIVTEIIKKGRALSYIQDQDREGYLVNPHTAHNLYWYKVNNEALSGEGILAGDLALISEPSSYLHNQVGLVYLPSEESQLCRIYQQGSDNIICQFSNPLFPPLVYSGKELNKLQILGKVIEIRRKY